ncbi:MAG: hypothetical protein KKG64_05315, partial [Firmicutes bacterium]|nr:hypothetical protein [Bacillota bacterium]
MFKKLFILFLILTLMVVVGDWSVLENASAATTHQTITTTRNHVLADVNEVIDLTSLKIQGAFGEIFLSAASLSSANPAVTITSTS